MRRMLAVAMCLVVFARSRMEFLPMGRDVEGVGQSWLGKGLNPLGRLPFVWRSRPLSDPGGRQPELFEILPGLHPFLSKTESDQLLQISRQ